MSLILDALKRSEAERDRARGEATLPPFSRSRPRPLAALTLAALAVVAVGFAAAWWWPSDGDAPEPANPTRADTAPGLAGPVSPDLEPKDIAPGAPADDSGPAATDAPPPPPAAMSASVPADPDPGKPVTETVSETIRDEPPTPAPAADDATAVVRATGDEGRAAAAPGNGEPAPEAAPAPARAWPQRRGQLDSTPPPEPVLVDLGANRVARAPPRQLESEDSERLPELYQLPAASRQGIGELTLNIHVFDERPENRFVLINLRRYREGEALNDDLAVRSIRPDGVVLDYRGDPFLLSSGR